VPPTEFEAVRTSPVSVLDELALAGVAAGDVEAVELLVLLDELLPHADRSTVASSVLASMGALRIFAPIWLRTAIAAV
jgi:hypothetical protein